MKKAISIIKLENDVDKSKMREITLKALTYSHVRIKSQSTLTCSRGRRAIMTSILSTRAT
jgi:hypothetical protein